jgi:signal transduction histidine kinase
MTIRQRSAWVIVSAVMAMVLIFCCVIYFLFANNHRTHFRNQLKDKALNTVRLLEEVKEVDSTLLSIIDANTLHDWRNEKTIVLNDSGRVVYSSADDHQIQYTPEILRQIKQDTYYYFSEGNYETVGCYYTYQNQERYVLVAALDEEQPTLFRDWMILLAVGVLVILLVTLLTAYLFAGKALKPLFSLQQSLADAGDQDFEKAKVENRLLESGDEIAALAKSYNAMLDRLAKTFQQQKQFVRYASHELRTPLAVVITQIDAALQKERTPDEYRQLLQSLQEDHDKLSQLVTRLLQISRAEQTVQVNQFSTVSLYELVEEAIQQVQTVYPYIQIQVQFLQMPESDEDFQVKGDAALLQSALLNIMANAAKYGNQQPVLVQLGFTQDMVTIQVTNGGPLIPEEEQSLLFQPFFRASNRAGQGGYGLGLLLIKNVAAYHQGAFLYKVVQEKNVFILHLPKFHPQTTS